jgi:hypothetical protein
LRGTFRSPSETSSIGSAKASHDGCYHDGGGSRDWDRDPDDRHDQPGATVDGRHDLGDRHSHLCALDGEGTILEESRLQTRTDACRQRFGGIAPARIAIEAGTHSPWANALLAELGHEVLIANPRKVRAISARAAADSGPARPPVHHPRHDPAAATHLCVLAGIRPTATWLVRKTPRSPQNFPAGSSVGALVQSLTRHSSGLSLSSIGMPTCFQYVGNDVTILLIANGSGVATSPMGLPNIGAFVGMSIHSQGFAIAPGVNALGAVASNGVTQVLGS